MNEIEELKIILDRLDKWLRKNQAEKTGTPEFREALVLHRQVTDFLARHEPRITRGPKLRSWQVSQ